MKNCRLFSILCLSALVAWQPVSAFSGVEKDVLEQDFLSPKTEQKPYVWWHWMGPNFSLEGITKDLESMKEQGIGGATIFNITSAVQESQVPTQNNPWPDQVYRGEKYWKAVRHAAAEAKRLGLEVGLHNTVGYSTTGGPWIDEERSMQRVLYYEKRIKGGRMIEIQLPVPSIPDRRGWGGVIRKLTKYEDIAVMAVPANRIARADEVLNISDCMDASGNLKWKAPEGEWIITRFISASTGVAPHPLPDELIDNKTFEADKMTLPNTEYHWRNVIEPLKAHLGEYMGSSFKHFLIDSYEAGLQSWCKGFREMFMAEKGYDPVPWMMSIPSVFDRLKQDRDAKRVIGDSVLTKRFEWDYRDFVAQMFIKNGWEPAARMIHEAGCVLQFEPYGGPIDILASTPVADIPMGEFWVPNSTGIRGEVAGASRAAGARIIGAEAFTGAPQQSQWVEDPAYLKRSGDYAFLSGVNRLILHHWVHQPYDDKYKPGMGMGWWGTHFGRHQTWAKAGKAYFDYLARCQAVLQHGEQVVDYLTIGKYTGGDAIAWRDFIRQARVENGQVVLSSGRKYKFVQLVDNAAVQPELLEKIYALLKEGGVFVAQVRPERALGLTGYPKCDEEVARLAELVWGSSLEQVRKVGKGKLLKMSVPEALNYLNVPKDLKCTSSKMKYVHKVFQNQDVFFVLNDSKDSTRLNLSFHIADRSPEIWDPYTGEIRDVLSFEVKDGRTRFVWSVSAAKSFFVVFRQKTGTFDYIQSVNGELADNAFVLRGEDGNDYWLRPGNGNFNVKYASGNLRKLKVKGEKAEKVWPLSSWKVDFCQKVDSAVFTLQIDSLFRWNNSQDARVKYFAGTATYYTEFVLPKNFKSSTMSAVLDLGGLKNIAEVNVNDSFVYTLWHAPFRVSGLKLDQALKPGVNKLWIKVTNTWKNCLIGDEQFESDLVWGKDRHWEKQWVGKPLKEYPEWFLKNEQRPSADRKTFVIWNYFTKDSKLEDAGIWGPVELKLYRKHIIRKAK